ncbi:MAG: hypothetical protein QM758_19550 [Armatimonas sp.]
MIGISSDDPELMCPDCKRIMVRMDRYEGAIDAYSTKLPEVGLFRSTAVRRVFWPLTGYSMCSLPGGTGQNLASYARRFCPSTPTLWSAPTAFLYISAPELYWRI